MLKILKRHTVLIVVLLLLILDITLVAFSTITQMSYDESLPEEIQAVNLIAKSADDGQFYFMNGEGDLDDNAIVELLSVSTLEKQSKAKSYHLLFSLRKKDFVLMAKKFNMDTKYVSPNIFVYVKNETVYIMYLYENVENTDKCEFAFFIGNNTANPDGFSQYKAVNNKYYVYYPSWVNNLFEFNIRGKMYVLCFMLEIIVVIVTCKKHKKISN